MKKYLQACEIGGSIYGKKHNPDEEDKSKSLDEDKNKLSDSHTKFYKGQFKLLHKVLHRDE